jgi:hypothetical protein
MSVDSSSSGNTVLTMGENCTEKIFKIVYLEKGIGED